MLHYRVFGEGRWKWWRPPAALVVCFIPVRESERGWTFSEVLTDLGMPERERAIRKGKISEKAHCLPKPGWLSQCASPSVAQWSVCRTVPLCLCIVVLVLNCARWPVESEDREEWEEELCRTACRGLVPLTHRGPAKCWKTQVKVVWVSLSWRCMGRLICQAFLIEIGSVNFLNLVLWLNFNVSFVFFISIYSFKLWCCFVCVWWK